MDRTVYILIGRSGCGKGTQAKLLLGQFPGFYYLATGDLMRDLAKQDTEAGKRTKAILDDGGLPLDDLATTLWMHDLAYSLKEDQGLICDGFPRRLNEAKNLNNFLTWLSRLDVKALLIDVSREEASNRLKKRARNDDNDEDINNRLNWYEERTVPAIEFYKEKGHLVHINGEQTVEKVFAEILSKI